MKRLALLACIAGALAFPGGVAAYQLKLFHTPDGNIGCAMIFGKESRGGGARCDIAEHSWTAPPKPKWCDVDYGGGLNVGPHRKAEFVCAGDTTLHQGKVLPVGQVQKLGPYKCKSLTDAMRCVNRDTGHGFLLSRAAAKRF